MLQQRKPKAACWIVVLSALIGGMACGPPAPPEAQRRQSVSRATTPAPQTPATPTVSPNVADTAYFLNRMADLRQLAVHQPNESVQMVSSHSDGGNSEDANVFQGEPYRLDGTTWNVLLDENGPGCITRFLISAPPQAKLRFYFDNEPQPRIESTVQGFFNGEAVPSFDFFLFGRGYSGASTSYMPMPYHNHISVLLEETGEPVQYQFNLLDLNASELHVRSFQPKFDKRTQQAARKAFDTLSTQGLDRQMAANLRDLGDITLSPNQRRMLLNLRGPSAIRLMLFSLADLNAQQMKAVRLQCYWDNYSDPFVDVTLNEFFGHNESNVLWITTFLGYLKARETVYSRFYMPFQEKAQVFLVNDSNENISLNAKFLIAHETPPKPMLYFYARSHERPVFNGMTYPFLEFEGKGKFIGFNMLATSEKVNMPFFYLEGDEFFYLDGQPQPQWRGTGVDNYFNGDRYFENLSNFFMPQAALLGRKYEKGGMSNSIRLHNLDAIPFNTSLLMLLEIGSPAQFMQMQTESVIPAHYSWTLYWYGVPAETTPPRRESVLYYSFSKEKAQPNQNSPVSRDANIKLKLPQGDWWINIAPIWDINNVQHIQQTVQGPVGR